MNVGFLPASTEHVDFFCSEEFSTPSQSLPYDVDSVLCFTPPPLSDMDDDATTASEPISIYHSPVKQDITFQEFAPVVNFEAVGAPIIKIEQQKHQPFDTSLFIKLRAEHREQFQPFNPYDKNGKQKLRSVDCLQRRLLIHWGLEVALRHIEQTSRTDWANEVPRYRNHPLWAVLEATCYWDNLVTQKAMFLQEQKKTWMACYQTALDRGVYNELWNLPISSLAKFTQKRPTTKAEERYKELCADTKKQLKTDTRVTLITLLNALLDSMTEHPRYQEIRAYCMNLQILMIPHPSLCMFPLDIVAVGIFVFVLRFLECNDFFGKLDECIPQEDFDAIFKVSLDASDVMNTCWRFPVVEGDEVTDLAPMFERLIVEQHLDRQVLDRLAESMAK